MENYKIQGSQEWLEWRKTKITGSDAAIIMGVNPWETEFELWCRKLDILPPIIQNEAMKRGQELEPVARKEFEALTGLKMKPEVLIHKKHSWMAGSFDGIDESDSRILEIKCGSLGLHEATRRGEMQAYYMAQFQHLLAVSDTDWGYFMSFRDGEGIILEIERDEKYIDELIEKELRFYQRLIDFDPPSPKHRRFETNEMESAVATYRLAKDMLSKAELMEKEARDQLISLSKGECIEGFGLKVTHYIQKGSIDYSAIPELKNIDLEKFRKPPTLRIRVS